MMVDDIVGVGLSYETLLAGYSLEYSSSFFLLHNTRTYLNHYFNNPPMGPRMQQNHTSLWSHHTSIITRTIIVC